MQIIIHRGTHQIGGIAIEISTGSSRILIDMGEELSLDDNFVSTPLKISGITDKNGNCDAVLFTHYHADHVGQLEKIRDGIPLYMGPLAKDILLATISKQNESLRQRIQCAKSFEPGKMFKIGDILITPFSIDHSACDSYMFMLEAEGKKILYTGDFRLHGFRHNCMEKIINKWVDGIDVLLIEGTTLSRSNENVMTEQQLQMKVAEYIKKYKYVFILCASTNLERICAFSKSVPKGKYFICDRYQSDLIDLLQKHWSRYSELYGNIKKTVYGDNLFDRFKERGFLMVVRNNKRFRNIISKFPQEESIILYSMWDGYRTKEKSSIPDFLSLVPEWKSLHTSGHACKNDIRKIISLVNPKIIIPIHTDSPDNIKDICLNDKVIILEDGDIFNV